MSHTLHPSRRTFIKQSSALVAGASIINPLTACKPASVNTPFDKKIGVALVGLGYYSKDLLAPALQLTEHCELRGIVTGSPAKIPLWQRQYGIKDKNVYDYDTMAKIANNDEIDVIYIVVPTALHAKYSIMAAEAGKHVWCEKPMAMNVSECQSIIDACAANKVKLAIGYRMNHEPNTQTVISYAQTKPYGAFSSVYAEAGYAGGGGTGWRFSRALGGGALYDMGVYTVNGILNSTAELPVSVTEAQHIIDRPQYFSEVDETTEFTLRFENDLFAYGKTSVGRDYNRLRLNCTEGWYELSPFQSYNGVQGITSDGKKLDTYIRNQQARQMDNDALAILNNQESISTGAQGKRDIAIINAIQKAAETRSESYITY